MSLNSVHTNVSAMVALQALNRTNQALQDSQKKVSTGYRISDAKDDGAGFAIAQGLRAEIKGYSALQEQLSKARGTLTVASQAGEQISNTLASIKATLIKLADENVTAEQRTQYESDYINLKNEISNFITNASFNGTNLLNGATDVNVIANLEGQSLTLHSQDLLTNVYNTLPSITTGWGGQADAYTAIQSGGGLDQAEVNMGASLAELGSDLRRLDNQVVYLGILEDASTEGLGAIVDADLAKESAKLQALQIQQQLGTQTLAIANTAPQILLSLFQG